MKLKTITNSINLNTIIKNIYNSIKKYFELKFIIKKNKIINLLLIKKNFKKIDLLFLGHADIVSAGDLTRWNNFPYKLININNKIFCRGICDMKGAIYAFIKTLEMKFKKNLAILISGDEERDSKYGARIVSKFMKKRFYIKNCLIGEPTSCKKVGDFARTSRRGSSILKIIFFGNQTHTAYYVDKNPIKICASFINKSKNLKFQCIKISSNSNENNVTPSVTELLLNIRFNTINDYNNLIKKIIFLLRKDNIKIINLGLSYPFIGKFNNLPIKCKILKNKGGTSDGRFLAKISKNIIEIGLKNNSIHKINENSSIKDINLLISIYSSFVKKFC
ncbi:M20/M25/M40 family metallo-hydrolase [Candidatus Vidania fulgoroideorum]